VSKEIDLNKVSQALKVAARLEDRGLAVIEKLVHQSTVPPDFYFAAIACITNSTNQILNGREMSTWREIALRLTKINFASEEIAHYAVTYAAAISALKLSIEIELQHQVLDTSLYEVRGLKSYAAKMSGYMVGLENGADISYTINPSMKHRTRYLIKQVQYKMSTHTEFKTARKLIETCFAKPEMINWLKIIANQKQKSI